MVRFHTIFLKMSGASEATMVMFKVDVEVPLLWISSTLAGAPHGTASIILGYAQWLKQRPNSE